MLKHSNWHFICSYGSVAAETATKPGSDCEYLMTLRDEENGEGMGSQAPDPYLRDVRDGWLFVFVTGIMGFASLAFPTHMR